MAARAAADEASCSALPDTYNSAPIVHSSQTEPATHACTHDVDVGHTWSTEESSGRQEDLPQESHEQSPVARAAAGGALASGVADSASSTILGNLAPSNPAVSNTNCAHGKQGGPFLVQQLVLQPIAAQHMQWHVPMATPLAGGSQLGAELVAASGASCAAPVAHSPSPASIAPGSLDTPPQVFSGGSLSQSSGSPSSLSPERQDCLSFSPQLRAATPATSNASIDQGIDLGNSHCSPVSPVHAVEVWGDASDIDAPPGAESPLPPNQHGTFAIGGAHPGCVTGAGSSGIRVVLNALSFDTAHAPALAPAPIEAAVPATPPEESSPAASDEVA